MTEDYALTTEEIRRLHALKVPHDQREVRNTEFDRWLDSVKADAWDEGAFAAALSLDHGGHNADNPYRKEQTNE